MHAEIWLNFVKTELKCKFGVNPLSFSHELCLYITRFTYLGRLRVILICLTQTTYGTIKCFYVMYSTFL